MPSGLFPLIKLLSSLINGFKTSDIIKVKEVPNLFISLLKVLMSLHFL